jgi:hypothetical protein
VSIVVDSQNEAEERRGLHKGVEVEIIGRSGPFTQTLYMKRNNYALDDNIVFKYVHIDDTRASHFRLVRVGCKP